METKRVKVALFFYRAAGRDMPISLPDGKEDHEVDGCYRVSEWVEVEFPSLPDSVLSDRKLAAVAAERARLQKQLAALGGGE